MTENGERQKVTDTEGIIRLLPWMQSVCGFCAVRRLCLQHGQGHFCLGSRQVSRMK